mgnify:FL=1
MTAQPFGHAEAEAKIPASAQRIFDRLDDPHALASHMTQRSWMMVGTSMSIETDDQLGKAVGSVIRMRGKVVGIPISLDEIVTQYDPPFHKTWVTQGEPKLLVIGAYRMGFKLMTSGEMSTLRVWIDYDLPSQTLWRWLGLLFGRFYAHWCVRRMAEDANTFF